MENIWYARHALDYVNEHAADDVSDSDCTDVDSVFDRISAVDDNANDDSGKSLLKV